VTAMAPVLRDRGGLWIGWPGTTDELTPELRRTIDGAVKDTGYDLVPVALSAEEKRLYYQGYANEIVWPLFHDLPSLCRFLPEYWHANCSVNEKFADRVRDHVRPHDFVWVHDYHLMQVAASLRRSGLENRLGFYLHIPFPPLDVFLKLPWRQQILHDLLSYDLLGFQAPRDRRNFVQCVRTLLKDDATVRTQGPRTTIHYQGRRILAGTFPISIDYRAFADEARSEAVAEQAWYFHEEYPDRKIILGVDRLDYTKGLPAKLRAYHQALRNYPDLQGAVSLVQIVVPSRWNLPHYEHLKEEIERLVGEINGEFTRPGWIPVHYMYRSQPRTHLLAYYRMAEVMLVTPWKDGMNLVAKEYCACQVDGNGVLILSEFAGATAQLHKHALLVNPHDIEGMGAAIQQAITMDREERRRRMRGLRRAVRRQDVFWWVDAFLQAALHRRLDDFPVLEEYVPRAPILEAQAES